MYHKRPRLSFVKNMDKDRNIKTVEREFLSETLKKFKESRDSENKLRNLQTISQLVTDTTDEELYELASATALSEDHRIRGEICYTISRSQRSKFMPILRDMVKDENSYVRRSAIKALNKIAGPEEATFSAIEPILDEVEELKSAISRFEEKLNFLNKSIEKLAEVTRSREEQFMDDYARSWETYLRHERELLRDYRNKYVAIYKDEVVGIGEGEETLAEIIYEKFGFVEALICKIEEEGEPIQMPPPREIIA
jgi:hypothetical protein